MSEGAPPIFTDAPLDEGRNTVSHFNPRLFLMEVFSIVAGSIAGLAVGFLASWGWLGAMISYAVPWPSEWIVASIFAVPAITFLTFAAIAIVGGKFGWTSKCFWAFICFHWIPIFVFAIFALGRWAGSI